MRPPSVAYLTCCVKEEGRSVYGPLTSCRDKCTRTPTPKQHINEQIRAHICTHTQTEFAQAHGPDKSACLRSSDSGFFYIEGTFYNDMRRADNMDYSHNIIEFLKQQRRQRARDEGTAEW